MPEHCHICREETDAKPIPVGRAKGVLKVTCPLCEPLAHAPPCTACGKRVRGASWDEPDPYHELCRRCSSCSQVVPKQEMVKLAGHLLCSTCDHLFGRFFVPTRRPQSERMKEAFQAWDRNASGTIEVEELKGVMKGLNPDFPDRDLDKIMRVIDTNHNGVIEYDEFVEWVMEGSPLDLGEGSFEALVCQLMHDAGVAAQNNDQEVGEVQVRPDGLVFRMRSGHEKVEAKSVRCQEVQLVILNAEEFIRVVEFTETGLHFSMNTGRKQTLQLTGDSFGPWVAPEGFHVVGLRTKPASGAEGAAGADRVVGVDLAPLPEAKNYDAAAALRYASEHEFLYTLRAMLSKAAVDLNGFGPGEGATALMLAAQYGNVGSMRLLISSKAKVDVCDADGWTALTYASRFGHTTAVDLLLEKGATPTGDSSAALQEALRHTHNSAARALLRAGFGPSPKGTFALEALMQEDDCKLAMPIATPAGSVFPGPVTVELSYVEPEAAPEHEAVDNDGEEAAGDGDAAAGEPVAVAADKHLGEAVRILFTLDGRDPFLVGKRYRGPLFLSAKRTHLRAVAIRGKQRSMVLDEFFVVCHYAIPEDVITGGFQVRAFPEVKDHLAQGLATLLEAPAERIAGSVTQAEHLTHFGEWLRISVCDPRPKHCVKIDASFANVRGKEKMSKFVDRFCDDIFQAVGARPENVVVSADHKGGRANFRAGCTQVEFTMPREKAEEIARQLSQEKSFLHSQARLRTEFRDSEIVLVRALGEYLSDHDLLEAIGEELRKKTPKGTVKDIIGVGKGDAGTIGIAVTTGAKIPLATLKKVIITALPTYPNVELGTLEECNEEFVFGYMVDVISHKRPGAGGGSTANATSLVRDLNREDFCTRLMALMKERKLPIEISLTTRATSRSLSKLQFELQWVSPVGTKDYLDGICMVYNGSQLAQVVDFRSSSEDRMVHDGDASKGSLALARSISRAVQHSGDEQRDGGGQHKITMDVDALPLAVTDLFFVLAAFDCKDLSLFREARVHIHDVVLGRCLTEYAVSSAGKAQAVIVCSLTRDPDHGKWVVHGLGIPTSGSVKDYDPIRRALSARQEGYLAWDRRKHLVLLRSLRRQKRITENATNEFARLLWRLLDLPITAFQVVTRCF